MQAMAVDPTGHEDWPGMVALRDSCTPAMLCRPTCYESETSCPYCESVLRMVSICYDLGAIEDALWGGAWRAFDDLWAPVLGLEVHA